jgi:hypothetical protein
MLARHAPEEAVVADQICIHCQRSHEAGSAFCPATGRPLPQDAAYRAATTAGGAPSAPPGVGGPGEKGIADLLQQAVALYRQHARSLLLVAAVIFVPGALAHACARTAILAPTVMVAMALDPVTHLPRAGMDVGMLVGPFAARMLGLLAAAVTGLFLNGVIIPLTQGALALAGANHLLGRQATWQDLWSWLLRRVGLLFSAIIPAALLTGVGFFFLFIPGVVLAFFFTFVPLVALFEGVGGTAALRRSYELVRADWLRVLLLLIVFALLSMVAQFCAGLILHGLFGARLLQDLLTLVMLPIPVLASLLLYLDIRRKREGFSDAQLVAALDQLRDET